MNENISICALLETHVMEQHLKRINEFVFGSWEWNSSILDSSRGIERQDLWNGLKSFKRSNNKNPWFLLCEWNVSLNLGDHLARGSVNVRVNQIDDEVIFPNQVTTAEADQMIRHVTDEEINNEMFRIDDHKSPGPDGYTTKFFK
ncbi:hypothetical protein Tco_1488768, partial [Tanacetum coccineum]